MQPQWVLVQNNHFNLCVRILKGYFILEKQVSNGGIFQNIKLTLRLLWSFNVLLRNKITTERS